MDSNPGGTAEAFQYTASGSGSSSRLWLYVDSSNTATSVIVGLYANSGTSPGALLAQGTITAPVKGAWNAATIAPVGITAGTQYWIAVLSPNGAGTLQFRDVNSGGRSVGSAQTNLTTLPATWTAGQLFANAPMSAYATP
jgi:hypothetical protein